MDVVHHFAMGESLPPSLLCTDKNRYGMLKTRKQSYMFSFSLQKQ